MAKDPPAPNLKHLAARFLARFKGLDRARGRYVPKGTTPAGDKVDGHASTIHEGPDVLSWVNHLVGEVGIGVVPITDENLAHWGAIDIDIYPLDLLALNRKIREFGLPLTLLRSKSGGAHLFLFMAEPAPARLIRDKLMDWAVALGYAGVEIFPKQHRLASQNDYGNWLNMPYFGPNSTRYAISRDDLSLDPEEFLDYAEKIQVTPEYLENFEIAESAEIRTDYKGSPPCLASLARSGFPEGTRNNALFNIGVYLKKRYPDEWRDNLDQYNQLYIQPPLNTIEVSTIVKSLQKKNYSYRCNEAPIKQACNRQICLSCEFGIGGGLDQPDIALGAICKVEMDPPLWIWDVNGYRLELETEELVNQRLFHNKVVSACNYWPGLVKPDVWRNLVNNAMAKADTIIPPPDATFDGHIVEQLARFCTGRAVGKDLDEVMLGKPYKDPEAGRTHFRAPDFIEYLRARRITVTEKKLFTVLRKHGIEHHYTKMKGKGTNHWSIPSFDEQDEPFAEVKPEEPDF